MPAARSLGKLVVVDLAGGLVSAPLFWYGRGAGDAARYCKRLIVAQAARGGVGVWLRNLFVPMFGQRDAIGIIISFFVRLFQIIIRGVALVLWSVLVGFLFLAYLAAPIAIVVGILYEIGIRIRA